MFAQQPCMVQQRAQMTQSIVNILYILYTQCVCIHTRARTHMQEGCSFLWAAFFWVAN